MVKKRFMALKKICRVRTVRRDPLKDRFIKAFGAFANGDDNLDES
jgi:hypothetical protein